MTHVTIASTDNSAHPLTVCPYLFTTSPGCFGLASTTDRPSILYMPGYIPLHDRPPYYSNPPPTHQHLTTRYGAPDLDITAPPPPPKMSDSEESQDGYGGQEEYAGGHQAVAESSNGHGRKRQRMEDHGDKGHEHAAVVAPGYIPQFFGIAPRNEFTKAIGEFILSLAKGRENVEVSCESWRACAQLTAGRDQARDDHGCPGTP